MATPYEIRHGDDADWCVGGMADIEIFTTPLCPYCFRAKRLLERKGAVFTEIDLYRCPDRRAEMMERAGRRTVPQIFIDGRYIGGSDDLHALDQAGGLDPLLGSAVKVAATMPSGSAA